MNKISLGKKIFQFKSATDADMKEWILLSMYNISMELFLSALHQLQYKDIRKFCEHVTKFGEENVTIDLFLSRPKTSFVNKIAAHYNTFVKVNYKNVYDPMYIMNRYGLSYKESIDYIDNYKKSKATNKQNFIRRYGNIDGIKRYEMWLNSSLKKGHSTKTPKSKFSKEYYIHKGYSDEQSTEMALNYQYDNSPLHINYYILRNKPISEARKEIRKIHDKKIGIDSYKEYLICKGIPENEISEIIKEAKGHFTRKRLGDAEFEKRLSKIRLIFEEKGLWVPLEKKDDYQLYRYLVNFYTNKNQLSIMDNYDKRGLAGIQGAYQLDHKYSIIQGYLNVVSPELIGSLQNLKFVPWEENASKQSKCSITLEELSNEN